jgi:hypothetical protein
MVVAAELIRHGEHGQVERMANTVSNEIGS